MSFSWAVGADRIVETATRREPYYSGIITVVEKTTFHRRTLAPTTVEIRSWSVNPDQVTHESYSFDRRRVSHRLQAPDGRWLQHDTTFDEAPFLVGEEVLLLRCLGGLYRQNAVFGVLATDYDGMGERFVLDTVYAHVSGSNGARTDSAGMQSWIVEMGGKKYWVAKDSLVVMRWVAPPAGENYTAYTFVKQD